MTFGRVAASARGLYSDASMPYHDAYRRLLRRGGIAVWLAVGAPVLVFALASPPRGTTPLPFSAWVASHLLFGAAFLRTTSPRAASGARDALWLAAGQALAVFSLVAVPSSFGLEGALLVLVALVI